MVTVIIPTLNKETTLSNAIKFCFAEPLVNEVIVVDDKNKGSTEKIALLAGAIVLVNERGGKGWSMKQGIQSASNELLVFLDTDGFLYPADCIKNLVQPLIDNESDFVKGCFTGSAGRVTELVARPMLSIFYPELSDYKHPLCDLIAGRKSLLDKIDFSNDYGINIGILIDMFLMQARIKELYINDIENKAIPWHMTGKMSSEVSRAIINKATLQNSHLLKPEQLARVKGISNQLENVMMEDMNLFRKMVVFNMDNTLLRGRFIEACADRYSFDKELALLRNSENDPVALTKQTAKLLRGLSVGELLHVAASIPLVEDAIEVVEQLRKQGNVVGIISDSYQFIAEYVKNKLGADFALGNHLAFFERKATGEVTIPSYFYYHPESKCNHSWCKTNALTHIARKYNITLENCVAIGDGDYELCMIEQAAMGIAFCSNNINVRSAADKTIDQLSLAGLLDTGRLN